MYRNMPSANEDTLTFFPFLRVALYLSLISLIALAKTLIAVLNTRRESRNSCLVTNSRRDALIFFLHLARCCLSVSCMLPLLCCENTLRS